MKIRWTNKIFFLIILFLLFPVFIYTIFQFAQRDNDEGMIRSIYDRQIETILFSVNTHCWDNFKSWASELRTFIHTRHNLNLQSGGSDPPAQLFEAGIPVVGAFYRPSIKSEIQFWHRPRRNSENESMSILDQDVLNKLIADNKPGIEKMSRRAREDYLQPFIVRWPTRDNDQRIQLLIFALSQNQTDALVGVFLDEFNFIDEIVARKFSEMDDGNFIFAVQERNSDNYLYLTDSNPGEVFETSEELWVIPDLELKIKLKGMTVDQISTKRTRQNLFFIVLVNAILVFGLIYLFRNISSEMALAQMKTDFVANVSHELRTPLALIRMHAETLEMGRVPGDEKKHHYYRIIMNESTRLTQLINNILDFSRIESQKKKYSMINQDLYLLVRDTLDVYKYHFEQKGFEIKADLQETPPRVWIDSESIKLAFVNLLDNAMKFSPNSQEMIICLKQTAESIILSVKDFGIGIPETEQNKIFDKFYRVGGTLVHNTKGSGLGLSLVQHIMKIHQGKVTVESKTGEGSTFSLVFPLNRKKGR
ncbi:HAMP domain-containing histidine kinase [candidate division KSB1 bacterium]|nr:HAMP domain-containing histidine kinase [candidate division KSB1 bacterium]